MRKSYYDWNARHEQFTCFFKSFSEIEIRESFSQNCEVTIVVNAWWVKHEEKLKIHATTSTV